MSENCYKLSLSKRAPRYAADTEQTGATGVTERREPCGLEPPRRLPRSQRARSDQRNSGRRHSTQRLRDQEAGHGRLGCKKAKVTKGLTSQAEPGLGEGGGQGLLWIVEEESQAEHQLEDPGIPGSSRGPPWTPGQVGSGRAGTYTLGRLGCKPGVRTVLETGEGAVCFARLSRLPLRKLAPRPPQPALRIPGTSQRLAASPPGRPGPPLGRAGHFPPKRAHFFALLTATCKCPPGAPGPEHNSIQKAESGG